MIPFIANPTELVGARPLHLACARPFGRLKAPLGLLLLRKRELAAWQAEQAHHTPSKEKQSVPDGERPAVHIVIVCGLWQGASGWPRPVFYFVLNLLTHGFRPPACMICYRSVAGSVIFRFLPM